MNEREEVLEKDEEKKLKMESEVQKKCTKNQNFNLIDVHTKTIYV